MPTVEPLFKNDKPHFHTNGGSLAVGYKLYTYFAGTNSPVAMYSDPSGTTIYENPIVLNSRGEPDGQGIYADITHTYKIILKDTMDNVVWSMDDVSPMGVGEIHIESGIENIVADTENVDVTISQDGKTAHIGVDDSDAGRLSVFEVTFPSGVTTYPDGSEILNAINSGKYVVIDQPNLGVWEHTLWLLQRASQGPYDHIYFEWNDRILVAERNNTVDTPAWTWFEKDIGFAKTEAIAPEYDSTATYAVGDAVMHNGLRYECNTAISTAEVWKAAHWTETSVEDVIGDVETLLAAL